MSRPTQLPAKLLRLINRFGDAQFESGEWCRDDDDSIEQLWERSQRAKRALFAELRRMGCAE